MLGEKAGRLFSRKTNLFRQLEGIGFESATVQQFLYSKAIKFIYSKAKYN